MKSELRAVGLNEWFGAALLERIILCPVKFRSNDYDKDQAMIEAR
jgi:hypothetical protein